MTIPLTPASDIITMLNSRNQHQPLPPSKLSMLNAHYIDDKVAIFDSLLTNDAYFIITRDGTLGWTTVRDQMLALILSLQGNTKT